MATAQSAHDFANACLRFDSTPQASGGSDGMTISCTSYEQLKVQELLCAVLRDTQKQVEHDNAFKPESDEICVTRDCGRQLTVPLFTRSPTVADLNKFFSAGQRFVEDCIFAVYPTKSTGAGGVWVGLVVPCCNDPGQAASKFDQLRKDGQLDFRVAYPTMQNRSKKCEFQPEVTSSLELHRIGQDTKQLVYRELQGTLYPKLWRFFFKEPEMKNTPVTDEDAKFVADLSEEYSSKVVEYLKQKKRISNQGDPIQDQIRKQAATFFSRVLSSKRSTESKRKHSEVRGEKDDITADSAMGGHKQARTGREVPDFVFLNTYVRLTVDQIEDFIQRKGHLPWMRPARQVEEEGFDVEDDFMRLLETVENMMLAVIDIEKKIKSTPDGAVGGNAAVTEELERWNGESLWRALCYAKYVRQPQTASLDSHHDRQRDAGLARQVMTTLAERDASEGMVQYYTTIVRDLSREGPDVLKDYVEAAKEAVRLKQTTRSAAGEFIHQYKATGWKDSYQRAMESKLHQELTPRGYQKEMANLTIKQDCILVAETGCGKTKVISMVLDLLWSKKRSGKVVVVIQNIPLALQQCGALASLCARFPNGHGPKGGVYGSFRPPKGATWREFLAENDFIVITPKSLLNFLESLSSTRRQEEAPFFSNSMIDWLVFDECHHCKDKHPFHELMDTHVHAIDPDQRPRVLGVTACIGGAEDVPQSLERIRALEKAMGATVFSSFHLTEASQLELKEYSARVEEVTCPVQVNELETWFEEQCSALLNTLTEKWKEERDRSSRLCQAGQKPGWKLAGVMERSVSFVDEALRLATDAGVYEALSWLGREYLSLLLDPRTTSEAEPLLPWLQFKFNNSCLFEDLRTALPTCPPEFVDEDGYARKMITNKQIAFVDKLLELVEKAGGGSEFQGMVFLRTRQGVKATRKLLFEIAEGQCPELTHHANAVKTHIRHQVMVGKGSKVLAESASSQLGTIIAFREKKFNLLLATSVAEEGMDFSKCNAVLRMDGAETDIALIQSKGRVRANGHFVIFHRTGGRLRTSEERRLDAAFRKRQNGKFALEQHAALRRESSSISGALRASMCDVHRQSPTHPPNTRNSGERAEQPRDSLSHAAETSAATTATLQIQETAVPEPDSSALQDDLVQVEGLTRRVEDNEDIIGCDAEGADGQSQPASESGDAGVSGASTFQAVDRVSMSRSEHQVLAVRSSLAEQAISSSAPQTSESVPASSVPPLSGSVLSTPPPSVSEHDGEESGTDIVFVDSSDSAESVQSDPNQSGDIDAAITTSTTPRLVAGEQPPVPDQPEHAGTIAPGQSSAVTVDSADPDAVSTAGGGPRQHALGEWTTEEVCALLDTMGPKFAKAREVCESEEVTGEDLESFFQDKDAGLDVARNPLYMPDQLGLTEIQVRKLWLKISKMVGSGDIDAAITTSTTPRLAAGEQPPVPDQPEHAGTIAPGQSSAVTVDSADPDAVSTAGGGPRQHALGEWTTEEVCALLDTMGPKFAKAREVCESEEVTGEDLESFFQDKDAGLDVARNPLYMPDQLSLTEIQVRKLWLKISKMVGE